MTDEQKTSYMRKVFKTLNIGDGFDYAERREAFKRINEATRSYSVYENPCIVLELFDPIMTPTILGWMYCNFDDNGDLVDHQGDTAPLFGYRMTELFFDKSSLMESSDNEKQILREAMRIINEKTKRKGEQ